MPDAAHDTDEHAQADLLERFFAGVSFAAGTRPDYSGLPELFAEGARLLRTAPGQYQSATVEQFVAARTEQVESGALTDFAERESGHVTESFGNVAHRFSGYAKQGTLDGVAIEAVGAISTQFVRTDAGWRISAMAWDDERPGVAVPDRYRP